MQVISRFENEGLVIGDKIHVTVLAVREDHVRLAISSPNDSPSYWEETLYWEPQEVVEELQVR
jgi:carbon storage regulator CsrA